MKRQFSLSEISEWISADKKIFGAAQSVVTDSRKITPGSLFVALEGERFDGHAYLAEALQKGAVAAVAHKRGNFPEEKVLFVGDTGRAYRAIARLHRTSPPSSGASSGRFRWRAACRPSRPAQRFPPGSPKTRTISPLRSLRGCFSPAWWMPISWIQNFS